MYFFLIVFLVAITNCYSQEEKDITDITKLTILNPGISYEKSIGKLQSVKLAAIMLFSAYLGYSSTFGTSSGVDIDPALNIQYRYYYNAARRAANGKRTEMNSLNYFAALHRTVFVKRTLSDTLYSKSNFRLLNTFGIVWGMQRNYPKRFSLDFNAGLGYFYANLASYYNGQRPGFIERFTVITGVEIGFWLNKKK